MVMVWLGYWCCYVETNAERARVIKYDRYNQPQKIIIRSVLKHNIMVVSNPVWNITAQFMSIRVRTDMIDQIIRKYIKLKLYKFE